MWRGNENSYGYATYCGHSRFGMAITFSTQSEAQKRISWKLRDTRGSCLARLGISGVRCSENIDKVSGGKFQMQVFFTAAPFAPGW
jgi:TRAP-type mannitol/chloroaromatic compound transport system substrate-binding protein